MTGIRAGVSNLSTNHNTVSPTNENAPIFLRTDLLPWYEARGYRTIEQLPLEEVRRLKLLQEI